MGRIVALHARFAGPHFQTRSVRFGREWHAHFAPKDLLEFSEYGRDHNYPHGSWLVMSVGLGVLVWMAIIATIF
ncbi:MAG TPA: hypothetical protein VGM36_10010 [Rhizomicrobium sp.]|jgi:hypothetical protein